MSIKKKKETNKIPQKYIYFKNLTFNNKKFFIKVYDLIKTKLHYKGSLEIRM